MKSVPRALLVPTGVVIGSLLTVASGVGQSAPVAFHACVGADRVLRLSESGDCGRDETRVPLGSVGSAPVHPGMPAPERAASVLSPNGQFSVDVEDDGITLSGGGAALRLANGSVTINAAADTLIVASRNFQASSDGNTTFTSGGSTNLTSGRNTTLASNANTTVSAAGTLRLTAAQIVQE